MKQLAPSRVVNNALYAIAHVQEGIDEDVSALLTIALQTICDLKDSKPPVLVHNDGVENDVIGYYIIFSSHLVKLAASACNTQMNKKKVMIVLLFESPIFISPLFRFS